jgi:hypothetical protein
VTQFSAGEPREERLLALGLSIVATVAAALSVFVALRQNATSTDAFHGDSLNRLLDAFTSREAREERAKVYALAQKPLETWTRDEYITAERVASTYAQLGFLMKHGYLRGYAFLDWWTDETIAAFQIIEPLIQRRREVEHVPAHFIYFEWLARRAYERRTRPRWFERPSWARLKARTVAMSTPAARLPMSLLGDTRPPT